jgi:hydrogenase expression/formation protein HypC
MCLAIPSLITSIDGNHQGIVDVLGVTRSASFDLTPDAKVGDYVLLHAGFSIEIVSEEDAKETLDIIEQFSDLVGDDLAILQGESTKKDGADDTSLPTVGEMA